VKLTSPAAGSPRIRGLAAVLACAGFAASTDVVGTSRIRNAIPDAARPLPLTAVRLTGGPLKRAQDLDAQYLLALQPDRMLAYYRQRAGLTPKAEPYGGWDGDGRNLTGHIAGHYLSAVSLMWAATGDRRFKERVDYVVKELKEVQDKQGDGYLSALSKGRESFEQVAKGNIRSSGFDLNGLWSPWYVLHKTFAGLRDAYRYTGDRTPLDMEVKFATWAEGILSPLDDAQTQKMLNTEFGGMPEVLADLYADTGDRRWLTLSRRFEHRAALDPLKLHEDRLSGLHGNTLIPKLVASASRFGYAGDLSDFLAATFFWDRVVRHHTFATGGHGKDEYFRDPDRLGEIVDGRTAESCNVYNMLKLTRRLFALKPAVGYAEFHERALFNHVLGSIDPNDGSTCYMVPVGRGARREYADMQRSFTCCVGTGMENHALHGFGIYYESGDRLWVNLFAPSTAIWSSAGVRLEMQTDFPEGESAAMRLALKAPRRFTLAVRRPSWAGEGFAVKVNGEAVGKLPAPPAYVELDRTWKDGDGVSLVLPKTLRIEPTGPEPERGERSGARALLPDAPALVTADRSLLEWLKPLKDKSGEFRTEGVGRDRDVQLLPFYRLHRRTYAAYWDLFTPAEWEKRGAELTAEREKQRRLEQATVAFVQAGEMQPERDFNQQGEDTTVVRVQGRPGRRGTKWFSFDLPVDPSRSLALVVTYHSDQRRARTFEISVDGQRVGEQTIPRSSVSHFFDIEYAIPKEIVEGKRKVTIRFQAMNESEIGPVFGLRMIRTEGER